MQPLFDVVPFRSSALGGGRIEDLLAVDPNTGDRATLPSVRMRGQVDESADVSVRIDPEKEVRDLRRADDARVLVGGDLLGRIGAIVYGVVETELAHFQTRMDSTTLQPLAVNRQDV